LGFASREDGLHAFFLLTLPTHLSAVVVPVVFVLLRLCEAGLLVTALAEFLSGFNVPFSGAAAFFCTAFAARETVVIYL
jgi:hypothetical protein